jgi:hypothetical protein
MSSDVMKDSWEELLRLPADGLKIKLAAALEDIRRYGIGKLMQEQPAFPAKLLSKLKQAHAAKLFLELPGVSEQLLDLLWEGVSARADQMKDMRSVLEKAEREVHVNMEASDSPFKCHFIVKGGKITGKFGLLHFKDEDFRFMGPTEVLIDLLTGDLVMGFSNLRLQTAGHSGWVSRVAPVVREIAKILKGSQEDAGKIGSGI